MAFIQWICLDIHLVALSSNSFNGAFLTFIQWNCLDIHLLELSGHSFNGAVLTFIQWSSHGIHLVELSWHSFSGAVMAFVQWCCHGINLVSIIKNQLSVCLRLNSPCTPACKSNAVEFTTLYTALANSSGMPPALSTPAFQMVTEVMTG